MLINDLRELGELIRRRRTERGLSQAELADKVGTTRQWVSRLEKGKNDIGAGRLLAVLDALDLNLDIRSPRHAVTSAPWDAASRSLIAPETLSALSAMADRMRTVNASVLSESRLSGLRSVLAGQAQDSRFYGLEAARSLMLEASERLAEQKAATQPNFGEPLKPKNSGPGDATT